MYDRSGNSRTDRTLSINVQNMAAFDRRTPQHLVLWGKTQLANGAQFVGNHNYTPLIQDAGMPVLIQLKYRSISQSLTQPSRCSLMPHLVNFDSLIIFHQPFKPPHWSPRLSPYHHFQMESKSISCSSLWLVSRVIISKGVSGGGVNQVTRHVNAVFSFLCGGIWWRTRCHYWTNELNMMHL